MDIEVLGLDFNSSLKIFKMKKQKFDYLVSMGIKYKEKFVRHDLEMIKIGYAFVTGENEIKRLKNIKKMKSFEWELYQIPKKARLFLLILKNVSRGTL
ncbi:MAG: hypothetical protein AB1410_07445 [Acidobacteriota bacterium]